MKGATRACPRRAGPRRPDAGKHVSRPRSTGQRPEAPRPRPAGLQHREQGRRAAHRAGELVSVRSLQLEFLAVLACQEVSLWVKLEGAGNGQGCDNLKWRWPVCWSAPNITAVPQPQPKPRLKLRVKPRKFPSSPQRLELVCRGLMNRGQLGLTRTPYGGLDLGAPRAGPARAGFTLLLYRLWQEALLG